MNFQELNMKRVNYLQSFFDSFRESNPNFNDWFKEMQKLDKKCFVLSTHNFHTDVSITPPDRVVEAFCYFDRSYDPIDFYSGDILDSSPRIVVKYFKAPTLLMYGDIYKTHILRQGNLFKANNICFEVYPTQGDLMDWIVNSAKGFRMGKDLNGHIIMATDL